MEMSSAEKVLTADLCLHSYADLVGTNYNWSAGANRGCVAALRLVAFDSNLRNTDVGTVA